jgi:hypothetical protein
MIDLLKRIIHLLRVKQYISTYSASQARKISDKSNLLKHSFLNNLQCMFSLVDTLLFNHKAMK